MQHNIHNRSIARAASTFSISAESYPNIALIAITSSLSVSLLPQINIVGFCPLKSGFIINGFPILLYALTKLVLRNSSSSISINDLFIVVKYCNTPFTGGRAAIGHVASMNVFPFKLGVPAERNTSAAMVPLAARTMMSPKRVVSSNEPTCPLAAVFHSFSLEVSRVPIMTS